MLFFITGSESTLYSR